METNVEKISDTEAEIMKVIWSKSKPTTYAEIRSTLSAKFDMGNQSIQTMIKRLVHKNVLKQEKRDVYYYTALVSEDDYVKSKTMTLLDKVFGGDAKGLLSALVSYNEVTPEDLEDLHKFWQKGRESNEWSVFGFSFPISVRLTDCIALASAKADNQKPFKQNMAVLHFSDCDYTVFTSIWAGHKFNGDGIQSGQGLCRGRG